MKRAWKLVSLALIVVLLLSVTALADGTSDSNDKATVTVEGAGVTATFDSSNPDIINVTVTGANLTVGSQYVVLMVKGTGENYTITSDSILYIDQTAATDAGNGNGSISFSVYPSSLQNSVILIAGAGVNGETGPLVAAIVEAKYILGDANQDGDVNIYDAIKILRYIAGYADAQDIQQDAADVDNTPGVSIYDAIKLLRVLANYEEL